MNQQGFVAAEFLFSFVLVICCGIIVFALTFSLMTIEVAQYITWSSARAYSSGNSSKEASEAAAVKKFENLSKYFPLLTQGSSNWFELKKYKLGDLDAKTFTADAVNALGDESRHPWAGSSSTLELKLFKGLKIPFLGKIAINEDSFKMNLNAFLLRNPSVDECLKFQAEKYKVIRTEFSGFTDDQSRYFPHEDNGC